MDEAIQFYQPTEIWPILKNDKKEFQSSFKLFNTYIKSVFYRDNTTVWNELMFMGIIGNKSRMNAKSSFPVKSW